MVSLGPLTESQKRLLDALGRPIIAADDAGRHLYQSPALHDCMDRAAVQERTQLQDELDQAVRRLSARARTLDSTRPPVKAIVLIREVLTPRSEFRLRGVLVPPTQLLSSRWAILVELERMGGLDHLRGGVWHPFRRKWATERKDLPLVDVMAVGGWKDAATLLTCYQHTDERSMLKVMATPNKLMSLGSE